jgi:hypothetical protein
MTMPACLPGDALAPRHEIEQRLADQAGGDVGDVGDGGLRLR